MEDESKREEADNAWKEKMEENKKKDEEKTSKNAKRRDKAKARKAAGKGPEGNGMTVDKPNLAAGRPVDLGTDGAADGTAEGVVVDEGQGIIIHDDD